MLVTFGPPISVQFLSDPCFVRQISYFLCQYMSFVFHCAGNIRGQVPVDCLWSIANDIMYVMRGRGGGRSGRWENNFAGVRAELFWHGIYFAKPRLNPESQSISRSRKGLGRRDLRIMRDITSRPQL